MAKKKKPASQKKYGKRARQDEAQKRLKGHEEYIKMKKDLDRDNPLPPSAYPPPPPFEGRSARLAMRQRRENMRAEKQGRQPYLKGVLRRR